MSKLPNDFLSHLLKQLKNNQNQMHTTGAQNLKEFNNTYRQILKIFKFMSFMDGTQKKMKLSRKVITHPSFASFYR
jgi:UDP-N-acetylglucosamine:LPS N-acetylglucosamine transferase